MDQDYVFPSSPASSFILISFSSQQREEERQTYRHHTRGRETETKQENGMKLMMKNDDEDEGIWNYYGCFPLILSVVVFGCLSVQSPASSSSLPNINSPSISRSWRKELLHLFFLQVRNNFYVSFSVASILCRDCTVQVSLNSLMKQQQSQQMNELLVTVFTKWREKCMKCMERKTRERERKDEEKGPVKTHDSERDESSINFRSTARTEQE